MKACHFIISCCFIFIGNFSYSQNSPDVDVKLNRMLEAIYENHIDPRAIDASFIQDFQSIFLESLDPLEIILSDEEAVKIREMSLRLEGAFRLKGPGFADSVYTIWSQGVGRAQKQFVGANERSLDYSVVTDSNLFLSFVPEKDLEEKMYGYLKIRTISDALDAVDMEHSEVTSSELDSAYTAVKQEMQDYFDLFSNDRLLFDELFLNAVANTFDPHTSYFSNAEYEDFKEELSSERELFGIGYKRSSKGQIEISSLMPGSSAWLSGEIHVGDILLAIKFEDEKHSLKDKTPNDLGKLFESNPVKEIELTVQTANEAPRKVQLFKTKVYTEGDNIKSAVLHGKRTVGYISLPDFYTNWESDQSLGCANDVAKAIVKLKKESVEGIILDLRNNGGGSLKEAVDLAGIFLNYGPILVTNNGGEKPYTIKDMNRGLIFSGPLIVMVNGYSASASEVVSAALQDHNRAVIVGGKSYGKATGQSFLPLTSNGNFPMTDDDVFGQVKITNASLYRINLETNQARGVEPDISLPISSLYEGNYEAKERTAIRLDSISKKMYYTPLGASPIPALKRGSEVRIEMDSVIRVVLSLQNEMEEVSEGFDPYAANFEEWVAYERQLQALSNKQEAIIDDYSVSYQPKPLQFDSELYKVNDVLKKYNDRFLDRLKTDIDLSETYLIMNQLIEN